MRLLLAEDNSDLSTSLVPILKRNNYSIDTAHTGPDALNALETGLYDGAILDVTIPEMDGIAVLKSIREKGSNIPILLLTTKSEENHCILKLESGADDYLTRTACQSPRHDSPAGRHRQYYTHLSQRQAKLHHLSALLPFCFLPLGQQGIPNFGNAYEKPRAGDPHRAFPGKNMGL